VEERTRRARVRSCDGHALHRGESYPVWRSGGASWRETGFVYSPPFSRCARKINLSAFRRVGCVISSLQRQDLFTTGGGLSEVISGTVKVAICDIVRYLRIYNLRVS
ncbi:unnamed protein product, partial [Ectocarpus sp. 12 AP-2014]